MSLYGPPGRSSKIGRAAVRYSQPVEVVVSLVWVQLVNRIVMPSTLVKGMLHRHDEGGAMGVRVSEENAAGEYTVTYYAQRIGLLIVDSVSTPNPTLYRAGTHARESTCAVQMRSSDAAASCTARPELNGAWTVAASDPLVS